MTSAVFSLLLVIVLQVMKMVMTLNVTESGCLMYSKRPGALLEAGTILAKLDVDDPTKVSKPIVHKDGFPKPLKPIPERKITEIFENCRNALKNALLGMWHDIDKKGCLILLSRD